MSGPKVVRVVSREEIEAICAGHLRAVSRAADRLASVARRHDLLTPSLEQELTNRRASFDGLYRSERWMELQKRAPETVAFLEAESARLEAAAIAAATAARSRRRRLADGARTLIPALKAGGLPISAELEAIANGAVSGDEAQMTSIVESGLSALRRQTAPSAQSAEGNAFAARLAAGEASASLTDWLTRHEGPIDDTSRRLDAALAELETLGGDAALRPFLDRAAAIVAERDPGHRALLADSLVMDAAAALKRQRDLRVRVAQTAALLATVEALQAPALSTLETRLRRCLTDDHEVADEALHIEAQAAVDAVQLQRAGLARRRAVLSGLAELGYEVRESMETALAEGGRVVVRRPRDTDYGVEVAAPAGAARVQVRLVGAASPTTSRNARRDSDQETIWCGDVQRLSASIAAQGGAFTIERAVGIGVEPVKTVDFVADPDLSEAADTAVTRALK